ncbi:beta-ketoacyl synthase N-terminal-like domain-containing protein [Isosphaeraceae bacterium EP7]
MSDPNRIRRRKRPRPLDVAIVGMACRFPGAPDLFAYWRNILGGKSSISDAPTDRWDADLFCDPTSAANDRIAGRKGGYLDEPILIDPAANGVMPHAVDGGEPEQHLVLDTARAALADAGLAGGVPEGRRVEVVIGRGNYFNRGNLTRLQHGRIAAQTVAVARALRPDLSEAELDALKADLKAGLPPFDAATIPGQLTNATAGRVANRLDLRGASFVVDAASASSLVALDLAARALAEGRADLAIAGGVYVQSDVDFPLVFSRLGALSRSGVPRPFGCLADGMVPGEGVGIVVLKRLADAERDGDRVYAVVKGVGLSSDGRGLGLGTPSARGHALAMRRAYRQSGFDPASVGLIEGHGLGVPAADRAELRAIRAVFPASTDRVLGAVSSMIGHAMPASGIAGLIKAALSLHQRALPPTLGVDEPHSLLAIDDRPCSPIAAARPWVHGDPNSPRRAGVNAFGFAGINAHAVLEEHASSASGPGCLTRWESEAILLSAADRPGLVRSIRRLSEAIAARPDVGLKDLAYTLNSSTATGPARLGLVVSSTSDLADRLRSLLPVLSAADCRPIRDGRGTYFRDDAAEAPPLAVIFPGEGSQFPGMLGDLALNFPSVMALLDTSDRLARDAGAYDLPSRLLYGAEADGKGLWSIGPAVNVVLSAQWALYGLLGQLGIRVDAVVGHSSGEFLALAAAGSIRVDREFEDSLGQLGAMFERMETSGAIPEARLLAVAAGRDRLEALASGLGVSIAIDNCPHQVVVAGASGPMDTFAARLVDASILFEPLPFARGYHTAAFLPAVEPLRQLLDGLEVGTPAIPIYSCASAAPMPPDPVGVRQLAVDQWSRQVRFRETIGRMHADGYRTFVDVGPRGHLASFAEDTLRVVGANALAMGLPRRSGTTQLNHLVASLFSLGHAPDTETLYARRRPTRIDLDAPMPISPATHALRLGFPEMRVSAEMASVLRSRLEARPLTVTAPTSNGTKAHSRVNSQPDREADEGATNESVAQSRNRASNGEIQPASPHFTPTRHLASVHAHASNGTNGATDLGVLSASPDASDQGSTEHDPDPADDSVMLEHLRTMDLFLDTQREIMAAYLVGPIADAEPLALPGPWAGEVRSLIAREEVVTLYVLEAAGDPVAEHHTLGGRRVSAVELGRRGLPVLPFAVMAEMLAQVASILKPGEALAALRDVQAHRWIRYEDEPVALEIEARRDADRPDEVRVAIYNRGPANAMRDRETPVVEGVAAFASWRAESPQAGPFALTETRPSTFDADRLYGEQWLFHGPALQAVTRVGDTSAEGIEGSLRILPRGPLLRDADDAGGLHTDPIILDNFTHLLGCWGLDRLDSGDVVFPLRMGELTLFGAAPADGTEVDCRIRVCDLEHHRVGADAEIVRPDGTIWMRIQGWDDWRFHWPARYRDVFRRPDVELLGEELGIGVAPARARAVWLQPPADMGRPVWRDVLEQTQLSTAERPEIARGPDPRRTLRLWGRIAAKDAARRLELERGEGPTFPADLEIKADLRGKPVLRSLLHPGRDDLPAVSIAHAEGVAVAIASVGPGDRPGIDVEPIVARTAGFEEIAFTASERSLLDRAAAGGSRDEWIARFWCAKEAAAKASGLGMVNGPRTAEVVEPGQDADDLWVMLHAEEGGDIGPGTIRISTSRRGDYAWAWTLGERSLSR